MTSLCRFLSFKLEISVFDFCMSHFTASSAEVSHPRIASRVLSIIKNKPHKQVVWIYSELSMLYVCTYAGTHVLNMMHIVSIPTSEP